MSLHNFIVAGTILSSKAKNTDTPKYQKLAAMLRGQTETGQLKSGQKLPPVREMAYQMGISSAQVYVANFVLRHSKLAEIQKMVTDFVFMSQKRSSCWISLTLVGRPTSL